MAKRKSDVNVDVNTKTDDKAPAKQPLSKTIYNRGLTPIVYKKDKDGPQVIQVNKGKRFETSVANMLLSRYAQLKEE